jgi:hypothetical protein
MPTMDQIYNADKKRWIAEAKREDKLMVQKTVAKAERKFAKMAKNLTLLTANTQPVLQTVVQPVVQTPEQMLYIYIGNMLNMKFSKEVVMDALDASEYQVQTVIDKLKSTS